MAIDNTSTEEARFRSIFRRLHAGHPSCLQDEWLSAQPRREDGEPVERPIVWSRRNGPWRRVDTLWIGAAPGNAGGMGGGELGAHGTRIPFGGDIAGANLDVLLASAGLDRNEIFIAAALNRLPGRGGGEPTRAELLAPIGAYPTSLHALRDTIFAAGPRLLVALGNVALRSVLAASTLSADRILLPTIRRLRAAGIARGTAFPWPAEPEPSDTFVAAWRSARGDGPLPQILWLTHPSAQNMSPYAGIDTAFHARMVRARGALVRAVANVLGDSPATERQAIPEDGPGVYGLPEWRAVVAPRHRELDRLWREKGV